MTIECTVIDDLDGLEQIVKDVPFERAAPNVMIASTSMTNVVGSFHSIVDRVRAFKSLSGAGFALVCQYGDTFTFQRADDQIPTALRKRGRSS